jgi:hypothetical protein
MVAALIPILFVALSAGAMQHNEAGPHHGKEDMEMMAKCPMRLDGTETVTTADTPDGIAVTFTTQFGDVAGLRSRLERIAAMHNTNPNRMMQCDLFSAAVDYEEVPGGARLTLTPERLTLMPEEPFELDMFRTIVREFVEQLKAGNCLMMREMMRGPQKQDAPPMDDEMNPWHRHHELDPNSAKSE